MMMTHALELTYRKPQVFAKHLAEVFQPSAFEIQQDQESIVSILEHPNHEVKNIHSKKH